MIRALKELSVGITVAVITGYTDMQKGIDGLAEISPKNAEEDDWTFSKNVPVIKTPRIKICYLWIPY